MNIHHRLCLLLLFNLLFFTHFSAQTPEKSLAEMTWPELSQKWEALASAGKNAAALPFARAALETARQDSSESSLEYGNSLDNLGYSLHHTGQHAEAEAVFSAAVAHARQYLGENHEDFITRLSNLAMLHMDMDELAKAVSELETAVHLGDKNLGADNPFLGVMVNNLGLAFEQMGDFEHALGHYLRALDLTERAFGKENVRYATRLFNISAILRKTGKNEQALDFNLRTLAIYEKTIGKNHPRYASGLNGLIQSYCSLFRHEEALAISEELLALSEKIGIKESREAYNYTLTIARLYYEVGQYERCSSFCEAGLEQYRKVFPELSFNHGFLARLAMASHEKMGRLSEAARFAGLHNHFTLDELRNNFSEFSEEEQLRFYENNRQLSHFSSLLFAARHPEFHELSAAAYDYQMTVKGLSLANRRVLFQSLRENPDAGLAAQFEEWKHLQNEVSKQYALVPAKRQANFDSLLTRANELERRLALDSHPFRLASQPARWQDVQAALLPGEAAIEFGDLINARTDSVLYVAWIIRAGPELSVPQQVFLFEEKTAGDLAYIRRLYAPEPSAPADGKNLRELIWQPLEPLLKGISTIYYAPAGMLNQVNLGAVPISGSEVMADRFRLHHLVSTRQLTDTENGIRNSGSRGSHPANSEFRIPNSALVFGGIRYESDSLAFAATNAARLDETAGGTVSKNRSFAFGGEWDFLTGTSAEALAVRRRLEKIGTKVLFADGFNASEGFFKNAARQMPAPALLHLATHGFFQTTADTSARIGFVAAENPMARAGLVLAGANRAWSGSEPLAGQEDGILTALEISRLDFSGSELAVLSACGTGQGKTGAGEGVFGLQRAFKMAGVRYVVMTLWNVQDEYARQFMNLFYDEWLSRKQPVPDAFREAQRKMRAKYSKPFHPSAWAGFVLLE